MPSQPRALQLLNILSASLGPERTQTLVGGRRAPALATA